MAESLDSAARTCPRCGRSISPRGAEPPRFCAICGLRLTPLHTEVQQALASRARPPGTAIAALVLGICSFTPMCGVPLGLLAIVLGWSARERIRLSDGQFGGKGMATAGMTLGIITSIIWALICLGVR